MARKLKTYITSSGFFDLAVAAPSMKAALEAWGMTRNAFQQGFAEESDDPKIVAATSAKPGIVLRRPVGTTGALSESMELPKELPADGPTKRPAVKKKAQPNKKPQAQKAKTTEKEDRAAVISFEKERARREKARAQDEAIEERAREKRQRAIDAAQAELDQPQEHHEAIKTEIEKQREKLDRRAQVEGDRWEAQRGKLEAALDRTKAR